MENTIMDWKGRYGQGGKNNACKDPKPGQCLDSCSSSSGTSMAGVECEEGGWYLMRSDECGGR